MLHKSARAPPYIIVLRAPNHDWGPFTTFHIRLRASRDVCGLALTEKYIKMNKYIIFAERDNNLMRLLSFLFFSRGVLRDIIYPCPRILKDKCESI